MVTLGTLLHDSTLNLHLVHPPHLTTAQRNTTLEATIVSELSDPSPWLEGGELLMTVGLALPPDTRGCTEYLQRLAQRGIAALALGLGPGLPHLNVPPQLQAAADAVDLVVLTVAADTPFVAVSKSFVRARAAAESRVFERAANAQRVLTASAAKAKPIERMLNSFTLLTRTSNAIIGSTGDIIAATGPTRDILFECARAGWHLRDTSRAKTFDFSGHTIESQALGVTATRAHLLIHHETPVTAPFRLVTATLTSLLALELERRYANAATVRAATQPVVTRLLETVIEDAAAATLVAALPAAHRTALQPDAAQPGAVSNCADLTYVVALVTLHDKLTCDDLVVRFPEIPVAEVSPRRAALLVPAHRAPEIMSVLAGPHVQAAAGRAFRLGAAHLSYRGATLALDSGVQSLDAGNNLNNSTNLSANFSADLSAHLTDAARLIHTTLAPLLAVDDSHGTLLATLRNYCETAFNLDATAQSMGVHRHTARARVRKIESLLGSLHDRSTRMTLELALHAYDSTPTQGAP